MTTEAWIAIVAPLCTFLGVLVQRWLTYRKGREEKTDERAFRLIDQLQRHSNEQDKRLDRQRADLSSSWQQNAELMKQLTTVLAQQQEERASHVRIHQRWEAQQLEWERQRAEDQARMAEIEAEHIRQRQEDAARIEQLEAEAAALKTEVARSSAEVARLRAVLETHGITY